MPMLCTDHAVLKVTFQGHGMGKCELMLAVKKWHVVYLPVFGFFWLPHGVPQSQMAGGQCETKQRLSWMRKNLLFWCKDQQTAKVPTGFFPSHFHKFQKTCQQTIITQCTLDQNKQLCLLLTHLFNTLLISV